MLNVTYCALTPQQEKLWDQTRVALLWHCPAFSHIFYTLLDTLNSKHVAGFTKDIPIAATDGSSMLLNPDTFFKFDLNERIFICAHEIMHCIWNHMGMMHHYKRTKKVVYGDGKVLDYDHELMNIALDLVINDMLIESKVGKMPHENGKQVGYHDPSVATGKDSGLDAYRKIYKKDPSGGKGGQGQGQGQGQGFDQHLAPGTSKGQDPGQAVQQRNDTQWATEVAAALNSARAQGKLPAALERVLSSILEPKVDWRERIAALFARKVGSGSYNWRTADRRLIVRDIIAPGRSGHGCKTIVVAGDTSGSIGKNELDMFFAEMAGILEDCRPERLLIAWCDAKLHRVDEADEPGDLNEVRCKGAPGGGGTSFVPVFEWMKEEGIEPDALVFLTDGYGTFPSYVPTYPVIWGSISPPGAVNYPFGDVVDVPKVAA